MAQSTHETRNPMEVSAKVSACMTLDLDYTLKCFTADDGEKTFNLHIPELDMERMFHPQAQVEAPRPQPQPKRITGPKRISLRDITKRLNEGNVE